MSFTLGTPKNTRRIVDIGLSNTVNLPNAATTTVNTGWLNMVQPGTQPQYWGNGAPTGIGGSQPSGTNTSPNGPYAASERVFFNILTTASTNGNNAGNSTQNIQVFLQHAPVLTNGSVDTGNIVNVPGRSAFSGTNTPYVNIANGGNAAINVIDTLPPYVLQFIRLSCVSGAGFNNANDASITFQLLF